MQFDDFKPKWIIEKDQLIIGKVKFHRDLACVKQQVKGGGLYAIDYENATLWLYGSSDEFGRASMEDVAKCVKNGKVGSLGDEEACKGWKIYYCTYSSAELAVERGELINV
jgi:hypothetical protein